jgi:hypothetical protein
MNISKGQKWEVQKSPWTEQTRGNTLSKIGLSQRKMELKGAIENKSNI